MALLHVSSVITMTARSLQQFPPKPHSSNGPILRTPLPFYRFIFSAVPSSSSSRTVLKSTPSRRYIYPDLIPKFAVPERRKFKDELLKKLFKDKTATFGNDLRAVADTCVEIFSELLHKVYGGPGTLMVEPFTDMLITLKEKKLPGPA